MKQIEIAKKAGIHPVYLNAILKGRRKASPLLAREIEKISAGEITAVALRPDIFGDIKQKPKKSRAA